MLVGAYSDGTTPGISVYDFNEQIGDFKYLSDIKGVENPSYLVVAPDAQRIYSVNETADGAVSAFKFDKQTATLSFLNSQLTNGADPCFINIDKENTFVVTANYSGGNISVFPLNEDGSLQPVLQVISFNDETKPVHHIHTVVFSPDDSLLLATDLGADHIYLFKDLKSNKTYKTLNVTPGSGPRHIAFHPTGNYLYTINELSGTVAVFSYNNEIQELIQEIASDTTPGIGGKGSADIHISLNGKFLYASNRLQADGIAIFSIHPETGQLTNIGYQATGIHPRNFILTPNGKFLLCANRDSNNIQIFAINSKTGLLQNTGKVIQSDKPVCLKWVDKTY
ncbi:6-phosphogluconolactonase [Bacteroidia bacterium]|nr:6-phosphogluconolactonase [Bacteroidia bacterium]